MSDFDAITETIELEHQVDALLEETTNKSYTSGHRQVLVTTALVLEIRALRWSIAGLPTKPESPSVVTRLETALAPLDEIPDALDEIDSSIAAAASEFIYGPTPSPTRFQRLVRWFFTR